MEEMQPDIQPFLSHGSLGSKTWRLSRFGLHMKVTLPEWFPVDHLIAFSLASSGSGRGENTIKSCEETEAHCFLPVELEHTPWSLCSVMRLQPPAQCDRTCQKDSTPSCLALQCVLRGFLGSSYFKEMVEIVACDRFMENSSVSSQSA